ncbi:MAG: hypothetical protein M1827_002414 [Pycnora praestabilis]|nr:MAG: hypothetical protein M1827_002414 [Pycnora praestabilis]
MARKARQRISYVLPLANSPGGHRLGVNGLAVDSDNSLLYSGGRDGVICAWDLAINLEHGASSQDNPFASPEDPPLDASPNVPKSTTFRRQVQAHTHWVNDIVLAQSNSALISASSDITVKLWRPHAEDSISPETIGLHKDYVKCLATPSAHSDWVASGGLDHKISLWDLNGGGERLHINVGDDESSAKGSVYTLSVRGSILASGGPESIVRVWDPKSGKRITKFVGHTDNIRDILINQDGDMIMTASSDQTIKIWSVTAGRCMHTLTMHNESVWSLYSDHPQLSVFLSSDRSGLVAKTDVRGTTEMDDGLCLAVCQEHEGVNKVVGAGDYVWTATSSSSINRWNDVDTELEMQLPESYKHPRVFSIASRPRVTSPQYPLSPSHPNGTSRKSIPLNCVLRLSNTARFPPSSPRDVEPIQFNVPANARKPSEVINDADIGVVVPFHNLPEESIEGQNGLIKHVMLNDRKRVLTLDTAGDVIMWDLLKCIAVQSFGKRHLEDVAPEVNTMETVANWCAVDTRTGRLECVLEENYCFDAEMYADELELEESIDFREDQRINLGKWVLRYLFSNLIDEEIKRDESYRKALNEHRAQQDRLQRGNAPPSIQLPASDISGWQSQSNDLASNATPRATNGFYPMLTPGLSIGVATPAVPRTNTGTHMDSHLPPTAEEGSDLEKRTTVQSQPRSSSERVNDYFTTDPNNQIVATATEGVPVSPGEGQEDRHLQSPDVDKEDKAKEGSSLFGKKFRMSFGSKKLARSPSVDKKPVIIDEIAEDSDGSKSSVKKEEQIIDDSFYGTIQKIRNRYDQHMQEDNGQPVAIGIQPSLPNETPVLKPPAITTIIIQEDRPDSGGVADIFRGTVASLGQEADVLEKVAPMWLGDLLLSNQIPFRETVKVSFVLLPFQDLLPSIASADGNSRLNANRMLRAKKILAYVAERIEARPETPDPNALKPEDYLELHCQSQLVPSTMTLATLRAHVWKTGGDVILYYKSNGRKEILGAKSPEKATEESGSRTSVETRSTDAT